MLHIILTPLSSSTWHNTNSFSCYKKVYDFAAPINIAAVFICWVLRKPEDPLCQPTFFEYCELFANYT